MFCRFTGYSVIHFLLTHLLKEKSHPVMVHHVVYILCLLSFRRMDLHTLALVNQSVAALAFPTTRIIQTDALMMNTSTFMTDIIMTVDSIMAPFFAPMLLFPPVQTAENILWYAAILAYVMVFFRVFVVPHWGEKRIASILTFCSSLVLTPVGCLAFHRICTTDDPQALYYDHWAIREAPKFFVAFAGCDMFFSRYFYPNAFPILDGWIHHITTGLFALWSIHHRPFDFAASLIVEVPTIILSITRMFPGMSFLRKVFPFLFFFFRILGLTMVLFRVWQIGYLQTSGHAVLYTALYGIFTGLNMFWLSQLFRKIRVQ